MRRKIFSAQLTLALCLMAGSLLDVSDIANGANAGIFKCVDASGGITYSQHECKAEQKTAKVMSRSGHAGSATDCTVAMPFLKKTIFDMQDGWTSSDVFKAYGGLSKLPKPSLGMINYIYTFKGNQEISPDKIFSLAKTKCEAGSFGAITCGLLPAAYLNEHGGCNVTPAGHQNANGQPMNHADEEEYRGRVRADAD